jgi:hypothetical protein
MLVDPMIVSRPGENGTPSGACVLCGASHPDEGKYALYMGFYYCRNDAKQLAKAHGILTTDRAQTFVEKVLGDHATLTVEHAAVMAAVAERERECLELHARVGELEAEIAELRVERDRQTTFADAVDKIVHDATPLVKASKPTESTKTRRVAA